MLRIRCILIFSGLFLKPVFLCAEEAPKQGGEIVSVENEVDRSPEKTSWTKASAGDRLKWQEQVRTGELSRASVELSTGGVLRLSELTSLRLQPPPDGSNKGLSRIDFGKGVAYFFSRSEEEADIKTPTASLNIRGTEFAIEVDANGRTVVNLIDGAVGITNEFGGIELSAGEQGIAEKGKAPRKTAVLEATSRIQWFLYYPGIVDPATFSGLSRGRFAGCHAAYASGDLLGALRKLPEPTNAEEHRFSAAVKLASGRIDEVAEDLGRSGRHPVGDSLRMLIEVVKGNGEGIDLTGAPKTPEGRMALSYALQSRGDLEGALTAVREAVGMSPEFGLAWARIAELEFGSGRNAKAEEALENGLRFSPRNAQAISLMGYLEMSKNRIRGAQQRFAEAIAIDPALGNAWLGQGLARYRERDKENALRSMTMAAAVEPNRSFFRSYLGKALATSGRDDRAANELRLAQDFDERDPTPLLYQSTLDQRNYQYNRAIGNVERSIELNDNRAIYRSTFLLDKDRSARQSDLATLYRNAGLTEASLEQARRSVIGDYLNPSAHLFLSNSVNALRDPRRTQLRYETPWFNELLIANLLSPAGTDLLPQNVSQQEYSRLFASERLSFSSVTNLRSDGEMLATGTIQGRSDRTSIAVDYDVFSTDGDFPNRDIDRRTAYIQLKHAITPSNSIYLNFKFEELESGDSRSLYDPSTLDPDLRVNQEQSPVSIIGFQHEWSPGNRTLMLGGALAERIEIDNQDASTVLMVIDPQSPGLSNPIGFRSDLAQVRETDVYFGEIQHIWNDEHQTLLAGARFDTGDFSTSNTFSNQSLITALDGDPNPIQVDPSYNRWVAYAYYNREVVNRLWVTAGLAYDWQEYPLNSSIPPVADGVEETSGFLPKAGLVWTPTDELTLRLGYAKSIGGPTFDESVRLEPTQVAGFIQSFRTLVDGSEVGALPSPEFDTWGAAALYQFPTRTYVGAESFFRTAAAERGVGVLTVDNSPIEYSGSLQLREETDYEEWGGSVYVNQLVSYNWSIGARYTYTNAELDTAYPGLAAAGIAGFDTDERSDLHQAEAYLIWNHESGWFSQISARLYSQDNSGYATARPDDTWTQFDWSAGKRFLKNRGSLEVGVLNLADSDYRHNPLVSLPESPRERTAFVELRFDL